MTEPANIRAQAARRLLQLRDAEESFLGFVKLLHPTWKLAKFQLQLIDHLDRLGKRTLGRSPRAINLGHDPVRNLLITMPPRHGKSTIATVLFPAWMMARNPKSFILSCSYNAVLAADFGRQTRELISNPEVHQAFPDLALASDSRAADVWRTEMGGAYYGVGLGGTTTGRAANLLNIDDPIKSREEAESPTQRNKTWDYYTSALTTRLQPEDDGSKPLQVVTLTRWHPDDLAGRIMKTEDWKEGRWMHVNFPAIAKHQVKVAVSDLPKEDPRYRPPPLMKLSPTERRPVDVEDEFALWPDRFPLDELKRKERMNPRDFASLYQQQPYIEGGNILRTDWWRYYPDDFVPNKFQSVIIAADTAFKKESSADFSVAVVAGLTQDGDIYILDIMRGRWDFPELRQRLIGLNTVWRGRGLRAIYIEDRASGQSLLQELRRESGMSVIPYKVSRDKVSRVNSITPIVEGGRVFLPEAARWLDDFINECVSFPSGTNDDQVDAFTMAIDVLSRQSVSPESLFAGLDATNSLNQQMAKQLKHGNLKSIAAATGRTLFNRWGE